MNILYRLNRKKTVSISAPQMLTVVSIRGTMILPSSPMCVCCSPAALRETPPAPPVTLLRYPAVSRLKLQPPPSRLPQLQLKVKSRQFVFYTPKSNLIPTLHKTLNMDEMFE